MVLEKIIETWSQYYLSFFLMIICGGLLYVSGKEQVPMYKLLKKNLFRIVVWDLLVAPILYPVYWVVFLGDTYEMRRYYEVRDRFLGRISEEGQKAAREVWYLATWLWIETKFRFACSLLIGVLSFSPAAATETNQKGVGQTDDATTTSQTMAVGVYAQTPGKFPCQIYGLVHSWQEGKRSSEIDLLHWQLPTSSMKEIIYFPSLKEKGLSLGLGASVDSNSQSCVETHWKYFFSVFGGNGNLYFQAQKSLNGLPDYLEVNNFKIIWQVGRNLQIGPDTKMMLTTGQPPVFRAGVVADFKLGQLIVRFRHLMEFPSSMPPNNQVWLFLPLGGTGP
jgi:hypothetical protein